MRTVPAVARSVAIIDLITRAAEAPKVSTIASELGIPRNTTYELIATLQEADLVEIGLDGRITPGFRLFEWGGAYARSVDLIQQASLVAREVASEHNVTVHVAVLEGREVVYLVKEEGNQHVRMGSGIGRRVPAHATGVGKALLAQLSPSRLQELLGRQPLTRLTAGTITDPKVLISELTIIADTGIAYDNEESSTDVSCVAHVVRNDRGDVIAGLSISTLASRVTEDVRSQLAAVAIDGANRLSQRLGWPGANRTLIGDKWTS